MKPLIWYIFFCVIKIEGQNLENFEIAYAFKISKN